MGKDEDNLINLRDQHGGANSHEGAEFRINRFENSESEPLQPAPVTESDFGDLKASDKVKVKFDKFVSLVIDHNFDEIFGRHIDEDIIISTDLLTDLAASREEKKDRKMPLIFVMGIVLGIIVTWFLLKG